MQRVIAYIDGFNLYFGLRSKKWRKYYWLNLYALATALLKPDQKLQSVHYFTSRIRANGSNTLDMQRQTTYLEALGTLSNVQTHFGHYLEKSRQCRQCGAQWMDYEEKMTDVNIAVQLLSDAYEDQFDTVLLVSGDSDLTTPVKQVRARFPGKKIIIALPPNRRSQELIKAANGYFSINETALRNAQLPAQVQRADGFMLQRPAHWK